MSDNRIKFNMASPSQNKGLLRNHLTQGRGGWFSEERGTLI